MYSERLKELRKNKKLTQKEVAEKIGVARTTYAMYEQNRREPDNETFQKIADFFNVTTDYLLGRSNYPELTAEQERKVDKKVVELLKIIESMPEEKREELEEKIIAYAKGLADASRDHVDLD